MRFRKRPVIIDAITADSALYAAARPWMWAAMPPWFTAAADGGAVRFIYSDGEFPTGIDITTLEGTMTASFGDWIIRGVRGELYPCTPDIFAATYEPVRGDV